jgi:hypothetical protein
MCAWFTNRIFLAKKSRGTTNQRWSSSKQSFEIDAVNLMYALFYPFF